MLNKAKEILKSENCACVLVREDDVLTSNSSGVRQLFEWDLKGAYIADKVVGKAAAAIMICGGVREVYAEVISESAIEIFTKYKVKFSYGTCVPRIKNREGTGLCPMEKACEGLGTSEECKKAIRAKVGL